MRGTSSRRRVKALFLMSCRASGRSVNLRHITLSPRVGDILRFAALLKS